MSDGGASSGGGSSAASTGADSAATSGDSSNQAEGSTTSQVSSDTVDLDNGPNHMRPASAETEPSHSADEQSNLSEEISLYAPTATDAPDYDNGPNHMRPASEPVLYADQGSHEAVDAGNPDTANPDLPPPATPLEEDPFKQPLARAPDDQDFNSQQKLSAAVAAVTNHDDAPLTTQDYAMEQLTTWTSTLDQNNTSAEDDLLQLNNADFDVGSDGTDMTSLGLDDFDTGDD